MWINQREKKIGSWVNYFFFRLLLFSHQHEVLDQCKTKYEFEDPEDVELQTQFLRFLLEDDQI